MKEKTKRFATELPGLGMVEGRTKIILTDVKTGKKKTLEHKNTFQSSYIAAQLRAFGACNNNPWNNSTWAGRPLWRNLCGGIFLFRDAITAPAEYMPAGNLMVANGSFGVENNGNPPELGSYNSIESSTSGNGTISLVWDWGTSQGNGTIACVCLTSELGGYIGYGNESGYNATPRNILLNQSAVSNGAHFYYDGKRYRVSSIDMTNKKVVIAEANDGVTVASIFQGQNEVGTEYSYTGDVVGYSAGAAIFTRRLNAEEFAIMKNDVSFRSITLANGSSARVLIFNTRTKTLYAQTINNTTGYSLDFAGGGTNQTINIAKDKDGNYYMASSQAANPRLYKFDSAGDYQEIVSEHAYMNAPFGVLTPELLYMQADYSAGNANMYVFDGVNERITNGYAATVICGQLDHVEGLDALCYAGRGNNDIAPHKNPLFLATINNLESAVTKDSTQTMKVIYTLSEVS